MTSLNLVHLSSLYQYIQEGCHTADLQNKANYRNANIWKKIDPYHGEESFVDLNVRTLVRSYKK